MIPVAAVLCLFLLPQGLPSSVSPNCIDIDAGQQERVAIRGNRDYPAVFSAEVSPPDQSVAVEVRVCDASLKPIPALKLVAVEFVEKPTLKQSDAPTTIELNPDHPGEAYTISRHRELTLSQQGELVFSYHPYDPQTKKPKRVAFLVDWNSVPDSSYLVFNFTRSVSFEMPRALDPGRQ